MTTILLNTLLQTNCDDLHWALVTQFLGDDNDVQVLDCGKKKSDSSNANTTIERFDEQKSGVKTSFMMNYSLHWMSFSALKLLNSCSMNYLNTSRARRHETSLFSLYLNYLTEARDNFEHFNQISCTQTPPWIHDAIREHSESNKISPQMLSQVFSSKPREKTEFLSLLPFRVKNCHYDEERKQIHMIRANRRDEQTIKSAKISSESPTVGVFLDSLCKTIRNFFHNDISTNLLATQLLSTLLQTPDRRLFSFLFDETHIRPGNISCLLHTLQILSIEGERYVETIPNFDAIFDNVKRALFPNDELTNCGANNNNNNHNTTQNSNAADGKFFLSQSLSHSIVLGCFFFVYFLP